MSDQSATTSLTNRFQERALRLFYHPQQNTESVDFRNLIQNASRTLVALPAPPALQSQVAGIVEILSMFSEKGVTLLVRGEPPPGLPGETVHLNTYPTNRFHKRPPEFWDRIGADTDFFLDLDPEFDLLYPILCRRIHIPVRAAFAKYSSDAYYNVIIRQTGDYGNYIAAMKLFLANLRTAH